MSKWQFKKCGCSFDIIGDISEGLPSLEFEGKVSKIPLDCEITWDLISDGNTKGVFQLESRLGQTHAKKLKPRNIEHLAALISIMRPGCLEAVRNGKTITDHYIDRKNNNEIVDYYHPALEASLKDTYGEMIYQEQAMQIARDIAGFDLQQADVLRKAIGKKKTDIMAEVKADFLKGCEKTSIVTSAQAEEIFSWIEKSQRYSFNKSHAVSYAINSYLSAYCKAHFIKSFFTSWLRYSSNKQDTQVEINELVNNAKLMDIDVYPPNFIKLNSHFKCIDGNIYFGLSDIKGIGDSSIERTIKIANEVEENLKIKREDWKWNDFLVYFASRITSTTINAIISTGAVSYMKVPRTRMLFEYELYQQLSGREKDWVEKYNKRDWSLEDIITNMLKTTPGKEGACANKNRAAKVGGFLSSLKDPPYLLEDEPVWISGIEESLLGIPITCSTVDACDISSANCTCKEFLKGHNGNQNIILLAAKVGDIKEIKTKKGKNPGQKMAFITVSDISGMVDSVVMFSDVWKQYKNLVTTDNTIMLVGERGKERNSFVVKKVFQLRSK